MDIIISVANFVVLDINLAYFMFRQAPKKFVSAPSPEARRF